MTLDILGADGHTTVEWDPDDPAEVEVARAEFERLRGAGFLLFAVDEVADFPAGAGRVIAELVAAPPEVPAASPLPEAVKPRGRRKVPPGAGKQVDELDPKKRHVAVRGMRGGSCPA